MANLARTPNASIIGREIRALQVDIRKAKPAPKLNVTFRFRPHLANDNGNVSLVIKYGALRPSIRSTGIITTTDKLTVKPVSIKGDEMATMLLLSIEAKAHSTFYEMKLGGMEINLDVIANIALGRPCANKSLSVENALAEFFALRVKEYETGQIHITNFQKQRAWNRYFLDFAISRYGKNPLLTQMCSADAEGFMLYLLEAKKFDHNYAVHILMHSKRFLKWVWQSEYITRNPFDSVKKKLKKVPISYLTENELEALIDVQLFPVPGLVRDMFLLQCFTGLAWCDLANLQPHNISILDNQPVIVKDRQKTKVASHIPISETVLRIISRYQNNPSAIAKGTLLPVHPNQKYNHYLKIIADAAGIKKRLTSHVGRRTFATLTQNNGANIQSIAKALGHSNTMVTERHYAVLNPSVAVADIRAAVQKLESSLEARQAQ